MSLSSSEARALLRQTGDETETIHAPAPRSLPPGAAPAPKGPVGASNWLLTLVSVFGMLILSLVLVITIAFPTGAFILYMKSNISLAELNLRSGVDLAQIGLFVVVAMIGLILTSICFVYSFFHAGRERPEGISVDAAEAPELHAMIDRVTGAAGLPKIDDILLVPDMNAFASQISPRYIVGNSERMIGIGLPLLATLSTRQIEAVLAHEVGHIAGNDGLASRMAYRVELMIGNFFKICEELGMFSVPLWPLAVILYPYRRVLWLVQAAISRRNEFAADNFSAAFVDARTAGEGLIVMSALGEKASELIWEPLAEAYKSGAEMPERYLRNISERVNAAASDHGLDQIFQRELEEEPSAFDSHPTLKARLENLGVEPIFPDLTRHRPAAEELLGTSYTHLADAVEALVRGQAEEHFEDRKAELTTCRDQVKFVLTSIASAANPREQATIAAMLTEDMAFEEALPIHETLLARFPGLPAARSGINAHRLFKGEVEGLYGLIEVVEDCPMQCEKAQMSLHWAVSNRQDLPPEMHAIAAELENAGLIDRIGAAFARVEIAEDNNPLMTGKQEFVPHGLADWHIDRIIAATREFLEDDVSRIRLVRNALEIDGIAVFHMLVSSDVEYHPTEYECWSAGFCLPGPLDTQVDAARPILPNLWPRVRQLRQAEGSLIYERRNA